MTNTLVYQPTEPVEAQTTSNGTLLGYVYTEVEASFRSSVGDTMENARLPISDGVEKPSRAQFMADLRKASRKVSVAADRALAEGTIGKEGTMRRMRAILDAKS